MPRYLVVVDDNRIADIRRLDGDDEEYLGIEWALSEIKDSFRFSGSIDGSYSLADHDELVELVGFLEQLLGPDAAGDARARLGTI